MLQSGSNSAGCDSRGGAPRGASLHNTGTAYIRSVKFGAREDPFSSRRHIARFALALAVAGVGIGLVGAAFRWCLHEAEQLRELALTWAASLGSWGVIVPVATVAVCALIGRVCARITPRASGSGIQDVEAVWREQEGLPGFGVLPARFIGGVLAIGSGMTLGREGPSVHLGASIGAQVARWFGLSDYERKLMYTTVGGAGLAVAFNAPIGGALFTIEEVTRSFRIRVVLTTLAATSIAVGVSRYIIPADPIFAVSAVSDNGFASLWLFAVFGALTAPIGAAYNALVIGLLRVTDRMRIRATIRATVIGGILGAVLWINPLMAGSGESLNQLLLSGVGVSLGMLALLTAVRFLLGPLSYAAGTPGGLFAPLLALGALWGSVFYTVVTMRAGDAAAAILGDSPIPLIIVGMAAFFAATVRAPLTGVVLVVEMTATTGVIAGMLIASVSAVFVSVLLRTDPIYDRLRVRMLERQGTSRQRSAE